MSEERKRVLEMLANGKITSDEAEQLLEKLEASRADREGPNGARTSESRTVPRYLRILMGDANGDKVNIRIPLALVRTGIKLSTMVPSKASEKMKEKGSATAHNTTGNPVRIQLFRARSTVMAVENHDRVFPSSVNRVTRTK